MDKKLFPLLVLVIVNIIPLLGLFFFGWAPLRLVFFYWQECAVISLYAVLRTVLEPVRENEIIDIPIVEGEGFSSMPEKWKKPAVIFVLVIYSALFLIVSALILIAFFAFPIFVLSIDQLGLEPAQLLLTLPALFIAHGFPYIQGFLGNKEFEVVGAKKQATASLNHILIILIVVFITAALLRILGAPNWLYSFVIIAKSLLDVGLHREEAYDE